MPISLPPKWQPTPVFLPGESHGWRSQADYSPWGRKELDTTERLHFTHFSLSQVLSISLFPLLPSLSPHSATSSSSPSPHWISFFRPGLPSWTPSTSPSLPPASPLLASRSPSRLHHTQSGCSLQPSLEPAAHQWPLHEAAGSEGIICISVHFSVSELSLTELKLGHFSEEPTKFTKEFEYLTLRPFLTWLIYHYLHLHEYHRKT